MKTRFLFLVLALAFVGVASFGGNVANAQETYPAGCSSALLYSVTTGDPCNGEDEPTMMVPGCSSALGYSTIDGDPCSGGEEALSYLAGCSSIYGYSTITALPCNGTTVAVLTAPSVNTPVYGGVVGFPTTGLGGEALVNILYLGSSALIVLLGLVFLSRESYV